MPSVSAYWDEKLETAPRSEIKRIQESKLRALVRWVYERSPYWHKAFNEAHIRPGDIKSLHDLSKLPYLTKDIHTTEEQLHPPHGEFLCYSLETLLQRPCTFRRTTGTTAKPRVFVYRRSEFTRYMIPNAARLYRATGLGSGDIALLTFPAYNLWGASWQFQFGAERAGATVIPTGSYDSKTRLSLIKEFGATTLVSVTPSYALHLAEVAATQGIKPSEMGLERIIVSGEPLSPSIRKRLEEVWNVQGNVFEFYAGAEFHGMLSGTCKAGRGMHVIEDQYIVQIRDPESGEILGPGERGELVVTPLFVRSSAHSFHYRTSDVTSFEKEVCECGRTSVRIMGITGRTDDMIKIHGVKIFPSTISDYVNRIQELGDEYQLVLSRKESIDQIAVRVEAKMHTSKSSWPNLAAKLSSELKSGLGVSMNVEVVDNGSLPRSELKIRRIVDLR